MIILRIIYIRIYMGHDFATLGDYNLDWKALVMALGLLIT